MSEKRILDESSTSQVASDDFVYMDGQTNGSRKITPDNLVRGTSVYETLTQHIADAAQDITAIEGDIDTMQQDITDVKEDIGDLAELDTTDKSSLVAAINEAAQSGGGAGGQPTPVTLASQMTDTSVLYLYLGSETGYDYGYIYAYIDGAWTKTTLYGKGQDGANGQDGTDGYSPSASVTQVTGGAKITITDENGTTEVTVVNGQDGQDGQDGTATDAQVETYVEAWLDAHPEAITTVQNDSITRQKLNADVASKIDGLYRDIEIAYAYPTYTKATINNDGTVNTSGTGRVTNMLPVIPDETLVLNNKLTTKIAYYASDESFISLVGMTTGLNNYVVPSNARYARYQNEYSNGVPMPFYVRRKTMPENKTFFDLIRSPLKQKPKIGFSGDSNTLGYGLSSGAKSWANLFIDGLSGLSVFQYNHTSKWVEVVGAQSYGTGTDFVQFSEISIWTDADEVTLIYGSNYSSAWKWLIDGVESGTASSTTISLDGELHKVTVQFTGGQLTNAGFQINKTITCTNTAESGVGLLNVTVGTGNDWEFIMIGTNDRSRFISGLNSTFAEYVWKGTLVVPFPNHKTDSSYTHSQMEVYSSLITAFESMNWQIVNLAAENAFPFYDDTLYQSDKIHISAKGHRIIANMVSGKLGLPLYLKDES